MLSVERVDFSYGPVRALREVSLSVGAGEIVALLGANGAGKTTLLSVISGLNQPRRGAVRLEGKTLNGQKPSALVRAGLVQVPEGRQVFGPLSVEENLQLGAYCRRGRQQRQEVARDFERVYDLFPPLAKRRRQAAGTLSGGEQQMVAMGRALMAAPRVLLLDEPSLGLAPLVTREILDIVRRLPGQGCSVLLVEQNAMGALSVAQRGYVLTNGSIRFSGTATEILNDRLLREAFLGPEHQADPRDGQP
ncbi:MAG: ABC transporter ATP-binding protein [Desulfarculus sp.]|nr:ABC transporter ATP-binding protein [Desulfarculus sp.]